MTPLPKRRKSNGKTGHRRAHAANKLRVKTINTCSACGAPTVRHIACPECGHYKGRKYTIA